ncbi:F0F1 ATP synthase subunit A [Afifella sp. IM 167]|uniref:F0F1 ATP synthase subunit A n=1 Tax=Afifella sp. IM 167 TaxID=2033586 RepID=UPI001CC9A26B|nr:F0F1 ATP synthase subunit A [Afifella sp. IM 167]
MANEAIAQADRVDPIHQFHINSLVDFGRVGDSPFAFTNSALFMAITVVVIVGFMLLTTRGRGLVPGRMQSVTEIFYEFTANMLREAAGTEGMRFFPFVFTLFSFILVANLIGMVPYFFTVTAHIVITGALALLVMALVVGFGFAKHGFGFLKLFVPDDVPAAIMPMIVAIEILSFVSRPVSLSIRLFANMLAGHITLKVFASFILSLGAFGVLGWGGAILPFLMVVALTALEILVAFLQAYVFAILTCMYLNDALHPSH